jgi:CHAT domain-containing protein
LTALGATSDGAEIDAWRLMTRGAAANFEGGEAAWMAAAAAYAAAAERWQALGRAEAQTRALFAQAMLEYWQLYNWQRSAELAAAVASMYETLGEAALRANALHLQGAALVESALETTQSAGAADTPTADALFQEAFRLFEQARNIHEPLGNLYDLGLIINNFGYTHYNRGAFDEARAYWEQAAVLMRNADEWTGELNPLSNLAILDAENGDVASAIDAFTRILSILPAGTQRYRADTLDNLGISHLMFGNAEQSLQAFSSALAIQREIEDPQGSGRSLRGIGRTYYALGELDLAKTYLQQALPLARQTNDGRNQEGIFRDLGNIAYLEQDYSSALELHGQALDIVNSTSDRAYLELLIAKDLIALGRYEEANAIAAQAQATAEQSGSELLLAEASHQAGRAQLHVADAAGATAQLERAAGIYERLNLQAQHAEALQSLAVAADAQGRLQQAVEYGEASLDRLERLRLRVATPELRAFFSSVRREYYENQIARLMALHADDAGTKDYARAALDTSERARARMIADLLQEASIDLAYDIDAEVEQRQTDLYSRLAERSRQRDNLLEQAPGDSGGAEDLTAALADIAWIENALNLLEIELRSASPEFASLNPPEPLTVSQMQALLDRDSVLLQYAFTDRASYVWVVSRDTLATVELADRETIETAARRVVNRLESYTPTRASGETLAEDLRVLAELLLAPVAEHLDKPRIVLSLDGALQYVPFAALPLRRADGSAARLLEGHEIVRVPSMSALAALTLRDEAPAAMKTLAVFADPVLDTADPRLRNDSPAVTETALAARGSAGPELTRLPSTGYEAEAIAALVPDDRKLVAQGFDASRSAVLQAELHQYRYIHFATHGLVDSRHPALSSLVMSQFDERGDPQNGFLRLHDIYGLDLAADLVVLSACETALGREVRGEGLLGLSQGFMYAGARSLIASLWQVPDRATAELMTKFYTFMLNDGLAPAEALRKAQLASAAERRWSDPYFWGGFVLLGDWR